MHKTGETIAVQFPVSDPETSGLIDADSTPTVKLLINAVPNAVSVAVTREDPSVTGWYIATVTLPDVTDGDVLQLRVSPAIVATVQGGGIIWSGEGCTKRPADLVTPDPAGTGAAIVLALQGIPLDAAETQAAAAAAITASGLTANLLLSAEIATVTSQTVFTLATGSDKDDCYNDQTIILYDDSNSDYPSVRRVTDYVGATRTVTIDSAPDFILGADDSVKILACTPTLASVWNNSSRTLTQSAASVIAAVTTTTGSTITIDQSYDLDVTLTGLTISPSRSKLWFSVKEHRGDAEADAWIRIEQTVGLERVYKAAPASAGNGSLTVDAVAGTVRVRVKAVETAKLVSANRQLVYDLKQLNGGVLSKLTEAAAQVILGVTLDVD